MAVVDTLMKFDNAQMKTDDVQLKAGGHPEKQ